MFLNNKYTKYYYQLVQKAKDRNLNKGQGVYLEEHHIVPRSLNGSNEPDNLVLFTAKEHYVAHHLLTKMLEGKQKQKMHMALWCMITVNDCGKNNGVLKKSNLYEKIRSQYTSLVSGKNHFNHGVIRSEETKEKLRQKRAQQVFTKEQLDKAAKTMSTLIWMNDGKKSYRIRPEFVEQKKLQGLVEGRITNYITEEYKNKFKKSTTEQWNKIKQTGYTTGPLIKL